jgi:hypothetical protein
MAGHWVPFVSSYDSQGCSESILTSLHTGLIGSEVDFVIDGQSANSSWSPPPCGAHDQILNYL